MVLDKNGTPLVVASDRRNEVQRCLETIGWSWGKLGDRISGTLATAMAIKNCKRQIADSDLRWLQDLADAHIARPRPAESNDPEPVSPAPIVQGGGAIVHAGAVIDPDALKPVVPAHHPDTAPRDVAPPADMMQRARDEIAEQSTVAIVSSITSVYLSAVPSPGPDGMTSEQVAGARWALGELAQQMGVLDLVQDQLRHYQAKIATNEQQQRSGIIGTATAERQPMA